MTKDFKNNLILLLIATFFAIVGWSVATFVDGNLFKDICEYGVCLKPIIFSFIGLLLLPLLAFFVYFL